MKEILFGWITKPKMMLTPIDELMGCVEIFLFLILVIVVIAIILTIKEDIEDKRNNGGKNV